ncbi:MAG: hypothetical protein ABSD50_15970 [Smithella sp.]|jgi:hypothetical protein
MKKWINVFLIIIVVCMGSYIYSTYKDNKILLSQSPKIIYKTNVVYKTNTVYQTKLIYKEPIIDKEIISQDKIFLLDYLNGTFKINYNNVQYFYCDNVENGIVCASNTSIGCLYDLKALNGEK